MAILWLGADVEEAYWQALFGVSGAHELNPVPVRFLPLSIITRKNSYNFYLYSSPVSLNSIPTFPSEFEQ